MSFLLPALPATSESNTGKAADEWYPLVSLKTQQVFYTIKGMEVLSLNSGDTAVLGPVDQRVQA